jgi:alkylhydroperoxidase family enzyme
LASARRSSTIRWQHHDPGEEQYMARVSHVEASDDPEVQELITKLRGGRGGRLINIYKMLLHNSRLTLTWFNHISAVRWETELDGQTREVVIIRIGYLNRVDYVIAAHVMRLAAPEGLTEAQCEALKDWQSSDLFEPKLRAALAFTDAMTQDVRVPQEVFDGLKPHFSERQIVELAVLIGSYNMHTRVLAALDIEPEPAMPTPTEGAS